MDWIASHRTSRTAHYWRKVPNPVATVARGILAATSFAPEEVCAPKRPVSSALIGRQHVVFTFRVRRAAEVDATSPATARLPLSSSARQTMAPSGRWPQSRSAESAGRPALRCRMERSARPRGGTETALLVCRLRGFRHRS